MAAGQTLQQLAAALRVDTLEHVEQRQRDFALAQVVVRGLAGAGRRREVEDVVLNLEGHAQRLAEAAHKLHPFAGRTHGQRTDRSARSEQAGRLLMDDFEVALPRGVLLLGAVALENLPFAERRD